MHLSNFRLGLVLVQWDELLTFSGWQYRSQWALHVGIRAGDTGAGRSRGADRIDVLGLVQMGARSYVLLWVQM
jgi:hypothetical protein